MDGVDVARADVDAQADWSARAADVVLLDRLGATGVPDPVSGQNAIPVVVDARSRGVLLRRGLWSCGVLLRRGLSLRCEVQLLRA